METFEAFSSTVDSAILVVTGYGSALWFHNALTTHTVLTKSTNAIYLIVLAVIGLSRRIGAHRYRKRLMERVDTARAP